MRQQKTYQLLFCVMCFLTVKSFSQTSTKKLANINAFNSILGNYFFVDANSNILPRCTNNEISFDTLYSLIKNNFNTDFTYNLESRPELKSPSPNVITLNLKFDKCIQCGLESPYTEDTHIDIRNGYIEGAGQFCFQENICKKGAITS